jgi:hypothetical protein
VDALPAPVEEDLVVLAERLDERQRRAGDDNEASDASTEEPSESQPSPEPSDGGNPDDKPSPEPTEEPEDEGDPDIPFIGDDEGEGGS